MQSKRQQIIDILKERGNATVETLSKELDISSVTVRHHLDVLRSEGLVNEPVVRRRATSGRPQHAYSLTLKAGELFPKSYDNLAAQLLDEVKARYDTREVNVLFEGMARRLLADAPHPVDGDTVEERFDRAVQFLNQKGYVARWEQNLGGVVIHTCNCPYEGLARKHPELCNMDFNLIASLTGFTPERVCHVTAGDGSCSYLIREDVFNL
ncbi:MAG: ArsR family transcriptional regulator [Chloroflexi bacterium]|nr:ArsR family transcriptional regulator [Chloroflexota bacterium]